MEHPERWNDSVILEVKQELGETKGRVIAIEASMKETREDLKAILKSVAAIPEMQRMIVQHDKRIGDLEQKSVLYDAAAAKLEEHLREDEPADRYMDRNIADWVKRGLWAAATGVIAWIVAKVTGG
jgi:aminoglycoside phosphotransferase (APT) family kinase protein